MQPTSIRRIVLCSVGAAIVLLFTLVTTLGLSSIDDEANEHWIPRLVDRAQARQARWLRARLERLELVAEIADGEIAALDRNARGGTDESEPGERTVMDLRRRRSNVDLLGFFHSQGAVLSGAADTQGGALRTEVRRLAEELPDETDRAVTRSGLYPVDGLLYMVAIRHRALQEDGTQDGVVVVAELVDGERSDLLGVPGETDVAYVVDGVPAPKVAASTLTAAVEGELVVALLATGEWSVLSQRGRRFDVVLGGTPRAMLSAPVTDLDGRSSVLAIAAVSAAPRHNRGGGQLAALVVLGGMLVAGAVAALLWRASTPPEEPPEADSLDALADGIEDVRAGRAKALAVEVPSDASSGLRRLVVSAAGLATDFAQKAERSSAPTPPVHDPRTGAETLLEHRLGADVSMVNLIAVDLRTLAGPETLSAPERVLARTVRDVERVRSLVEQSGGRLEVWQGTLRYRPTTMMIRSSR